jgi:chorismate mutase
MLHDDSDDLAELRREIDRIDSALLALVVERREVSMRIGARKGDGGRALRPGREAAVLRRLAEEASGALPTDALVRLWREVFALSIRAQGPFAVSVCASSGDRSVWDLARGHFGHATPFRRVDRAARALRDVAEDEVQAAVLPAPSDEVLWWTGLVDSQPRLHVTARLPFVVGDPRGEADGGEAMVVAARPPDPSGDDVTLLALSARGQSSRGRLRDLLAEAGFAATWRGATSGEGGSDTWHLIEVSGFVDADEPRLRELPRDHPREMDRCVRLGAWARPFSAGES